MSNEKRTPSSDTVPIDRAELDRRLREVFGDEAERAERRDEIPPPPPSGVFTKGTRR